ncbi:MAG TPA: J domain-containing protein [Phycisphaerae bacterium]|nr:J domain-containing protein [Phycisphaerae bacterium]
MSYLRCYQILGLQPGASAEQVHRAYKQLALRYHPDRSVGDPDSHRIFCQATEAYSRLKNALFAHARLRNVGFCPKCEQVAELYQGMDRRHYCATCLLHSRRRFLPLPSFQKVRCIVAITLQGLALYCVIVSTLTGDWLPGAAAVLFALAAMCALAVNFLTADLIER